MKRYYLFPAILLISGISAFSQERPQYADDYYLQIRVPVQRQSASPVEGEDKETPGVGTPNPGVKHYLPSPSTGDKNKELVRKTAKVTMTVSDGFAEAEAPRQAETARLTMGTSSRLKGYTTGDAFVDSLIVDSSRRYSIDPLLIYAQMGQESSFNPRARSYKGASGLMQLMPATARRLGVTKIYDPKQNIDGGVKYMRMLLDMFGQNVTLALAGYNAGEGAVMKYGNQIPPYNETQDYVRRISARYNAISTATLARTHWGSK